jgi:membrane-associated phospholipid phosphatase
MKSLHALKQFIIKYKHGVILTYFFIYIAWFTYLERTVTTSFHPIYSKLDDLIPFNEVFIIPYFLWFLYIAVTVIYFLFHEKPDFYRLCANLFIGMTVCLTIYTVWPNGHYLRVDLDSLGRSNIFISMLSEIYKLDTATNVFPSIHVFNSVAALIAIRRNDHLRRIKWLQWGTLLLTVLICMSTVFLKQHSVMDILGGLTLNVIMYFIIYVPSWMKQPERARKELSNI